MVFVVKWLIKLLRDKNRVIKLNDLIELIVSSIYGKGASIKKRLELQSMAVRNRYLLKYLR